MGHLTSFQYQTLDTVTADCFKEGLLNDEKMPRLYEKLRKTILFRIFSGYYLKQMFRTSFITYWSISILIVVLLSCMDDDTTSNPIQPIDLTIETNLNPSGFAPLSAKMNISSETAFHLELTIKGKHGSRSDLKISPEEMTDFHEVDVHGLYAGYPNEIKIIARDENQNIVASIIDTILTTALISDMPEIEVLEENLDEDYIVLYLVNYYGYDVAFQPHHPFLVDQFGDIRWYWDFTGDEELGDLFFDNGLFHMQNNDMVFSSSASYKVFMTDLFGNVKQKILLGDYSFHHSVVEKQDGNLLVTANKLNRPTVQDIILEIDTATASIVHVWDLSESLDKNRTTLTFDSNDWLHTNGVVYDERDHTIIISGRTQGTVKLNYDNEIQWIMGTHKGWGSSTNGVDLNQFLLQPLHQDGTPITNQAVLDGDENAQDFEWNWYQHSPIILPNGNYMVFDNGLNRNYRSDSLYSRAVEYEIDQENMTVRQVWNYGKELGANGYSRGASKVNFMPDINQVMFASGAITENGPNHGRMIEVNKETKEVKIDMKITPPESFFSITFHNAQRFEFR